MKASTLSRKEQQKEVRRLVKNLSRRIARIENLNLSGSQYAINRYREIEKTLPKNLRTATDKQIQTLYRGVRYVDSLKTGTVKGAKETMKTFEPIKEKLSILSKDTRQKFWEAYGKLYENSSTMANFKYELFDVLSDVMLQGVDTEQLVIDIIDEYMNTLEQLGGEVTDEEIKVLFTDKLTSFKK